MFLANSQMIVPVCNPYCLIDKSIIPVQNYENEKVLDKYNQ